MMERKSLPITKGMVWEAYKQVRRNRGGPGIDQVTLTEYAADLSSNLYRLWNRMTSGSYFPSPVKEVHIPKGTGKTRALGIPTVDDRIAQMVVKQYLEPKIDPHFHGSSYGYRPGKSAHQALSSCRRNCWSQAWVIDLDIQNFFEEIDHDLLLRALKRHTSERWVFLYVKRWLRVGRVKSDGSLLARDRGTPQGGVISPLLANLFLHYAFDKWMEKHDRSIRFERYADDIVIHCSDQRRATQLLSSVKERLGGCGLRLHPGKTRIVYCKTESRKQVYPIVSFDFLGFTFKPRRSKRKDGKLFMGFNPAVSRKSLKKMNARIKVLKLHRWSHKTLEEISEELNPILRGWIDYFSRFRPSALLPFFYRLDNRLLKWVQNKYKSMRTSKRKAISWLKAKAVENPGLFVHWATGLAPIARTE